MKITIEGSRVTAVSETKEEAYRLIDMAVGERPGQERKKKKQDKWTAGEVERLKVLRGESGEPTLTFASRVAPDFMRSVGSVYGKVHYMERVGQIPRKLQVK